MMLSRLSYLALLAAVTTLAAYGHEPDSPSDADNQKCAVEGVALDATSGEALRKATIELAPWSGSGASYRATTDQSGHFSFHAIPPGDFWLRGVHTGYLETVLGSQRSSTKGTMLRLSAGATLSELQLKLTRASIISGKVIDDSGEPVVQALVEAYKPVWFRGHREYNQSGQGSTNDFGEFRITGLAAGRYYLYASLNESPYLEEQGKPEKRRLPAFHPDAPTLAATKPVEIQPGESVPGVDIRVHTAETFSVQGKIGASPKADALPSVVAVRDGLDRQHWAAGETEVNRDGTFRIDGLPAGTYQLQVVGERSGGYAIASLPIEIKASDIKGILIPVAAPVEISGTIHFIDAAARTTAYAISLFEADFGATSNTSGEIEEDGTFRASAPPGRYIISLGPGSDEDYVKSISYGGQEVLGQIIDFSQGSVGEVEITVTKGAGRVEGSVSQDDSDIPKEKAGAVQVALISARARFDPAGAILTPADQTGHFSFRGVPPGKYYAFAAQDVDAGLWENRDFFEQIRGAGVEVNIAESGRVQVQVPLLASSDVERALTALGL
jgi:protocatechuate 3,4-dioxygenase beta subunit